mmetsp:Transcript_3697/g.5649  ORF Transcript_3697/g.5649 Transcript_3697/m.5649 type:complete len:232 (-) Transcript_3697:679-1374(-)
MIRQRSLQYDTVRYTYSVCQQKETYLFLQSLSYNHQDSSENLCCRSRHIPRRAQSGCNRLGRFGSIKSLIVSNTHILQKTRFCFLNGVIFLEQHPCNCQKHLLCRFHTASARDILLRFRIRVCTILGNSFMVGNYFCSSFQCKFTMAFVLLHCILESIHQCHGSTFRFLDGCNCSRIPFFPKKSSKHGTCSNPRVFITTSTFRKWRIRLHGLKPFRKNWSIFKDIHTLGKR